MALFGEKYGDQVRLVAIGDFSRELCGGTHVRHTSELALFKILSDTGIGTGTRRIEALTGAELLRYYKGQERLVDQVAEELKVAPDKLLLKIEQLQHQLRTYEKDLEDLRGRAMLNDVDVLLGKVVEVEGVKLLTAKLQDFDLEALRSFGDILKQRLGSGVIVLGSVIAGKVGLVSFVTSDLVKAGWIACGRHRPGSGPAGGRRRWRQAGYGPGRGQGPGSLGRGASGRGDHSPAPTGQLKSGVSAELVFNGMLKSPVYQMSQMQYENRYRRHSLDADSPEILNRESGWHP